MKKLGFLLFVLSAPAALANPQVALNTAVASGSQVNWATEEGKQANSSQVRTLNNNTLSLGQMVNKDLDEKIAERLRAQSDRQ